jgi:ribose 5-phosphate isomerase A
LFAIAEKVKKENLNVRIIPSSLEITMTCSNLGMPVTSLLEDRPDWAFDGADEVDPNRSLIKGRGGALFKEKLLIRSSLKNYILVDESKLVENLGSKFPVPIEVFPGALVYVESALRDLGITDIILRAAKGKDGPIITENGNFLLDARFDHIPSDTEQKIKSITGVIESGLFIGYDVEVLVAE